MSAIRESLANLQRKSDQELHEVSQRVRRKLSTAEWELGLCLEVSHSRRGYQKLGYSSLDDYAERGLKLSRKDVYRMLSTARALLHLPRLSEAYRQGRLSWASLRALQGVVTPETETLWLEFALKHGSDEVSRRVAMTPSEWKRQQGLKASLKSHPLVTPEMVKVVLEAGRPPVRPATARAATCPTTPSGQPQDVRAEAPTPGIKAEDGPAQTAPPFSPKVVRLTFDLTPDQFALYETAERRVRDQAGKHISRALVLTAMSEAVLSAGTSRARAKYQILVHTHDQKHFFYDTEQGPMTVGPQALRTARAQNLPTSVEAPDKIVDTRRPEAGQSLSRTSDVRSTEAAAPCEAAESGGPVRSAPNKRGQNGAPSPSPRAETEGPSHGANLGKSPPPVRKRVPVPAGTLRSLYARANSRCEICGGRAYLQVHHKTPVSEGGGHRLEDLELRCGLCHDHAHLDDYHGKPGWRTARGQALRKRKRKREPAEERWFHYDFGHLPSG